VHGIDKMIAKRLVEQFGLSTLEIIERAPERLALPARTGRGDPRPW